MEANNSYCGVGIAFNARIGGEESGGRRHIVGGLQWPGLWREEETLSETFEIAHLTNPLCIYAIETNLKVTFSFKYAVYVIAIIKI